MISKIIITFVIAVWFVLGATVTFAQTITTSPPVSNVTMPVPKSVVDQAERQARGEFTSMLRSTVGGQVQEAWDNVDENAGVIRFSYCGMCTYKVSLREHMVTVIEFPEGEIIERADVGDQNEFQVNMRGPSRLAIQPAGYGVDTNLIVYGKTGAIYPIYLRSERFNSVNVPDLLVRIEGAMTTKDIEVGGIGNNTKKTLLPDGLSGFPSPEQSDAVNGLEQTDPKRASGDFIQEAAFDPDKLRGWGDYKLWGDGDNVDDLKPMTVFRDDYFTYIRFDEKWNDIELPTAYVVIDGIDELVNTRIQGRTYIIESTQKLITLKSGLTFICIEYTGDA